jgi:predicted phosphoribosyltransferase
VIVPIALAMAAAGGLPPAALALPVAITIGYAFMLPMNTVPNVIMLDAGFLLVTRDVRLQNDPHRCRRRRPADAGGAVPAGARKVPRMTGAQWAGGRLKSRSMALAAKGRDAEPDQGSVHRVDAAGGMAVFKDRCDAGLQLARRLSAYATLRPVVVALPRGGVPVAAEIADCLDAPLDVIVVRKIGLPWQQELAIGAVAEGNVCVMNDALIEEAGVSEDALEAAIARERVELERRVRAYRGERSPLRLEDRVVILVDDGLATGYTARAAIAVIRRRGASRVVLAVPVAPADCVATTGRVADEFVVLQTPTWFLSIGEHYEDFRQTSDDEVVALLQRAAKRATGRGAEVPARA